MASSAFKSWPLLLPVCWQTFAFGRKRQETDWDTHVPPSARVYESEVFRDQWCSTTQRSHYISVMLRRPIHTDPARHLSYGEAAKSTTRDSVHELERSQRPACSMNAISAWGEPPRLTNDIVHRRRVETFSAARSCWSEILKFHS